MRAKRYSPGSAFTENELFSTGLSKDLMFAITAAPSRNTVINRVSVWHDYLLCWRCWLLFLSQKSQNPSLSLSGHALLTWIKAAHNTFLVLWCDLAILGVLLLWSYA